MSNKAAAANRPTTAGRRPPKMLFTVGVFMYFRNILAMRIMRMNEGSTRAKVAVQLPSTAIVSPMWAFFTAV